MNMAMAVVTTVVVTVIPAASSWTVYVPGRTKGPLGPLNPASSSSSKGRPIRRSQNHSCIPLLPEPGSRTVRTTFPAWSRTVILDAKCSSAGA